jgi:transcriptional regulator with XRE-family HTH domain
MQVQTIKDLVEQIKKRRKDLGISQVELAQLCNLSVNGISKFESNAGEREVKLSTLFKLSQILGFKLSLEFEE